MKKYLAALSVVLLVGCAAGQSGALSGKGHGSYLDYPYSDKDGVVKIHRVYADGHQEWIEPSALAE